MAENKEKPKKDDFGLDLEEMAKAGLHFGHKTSRTHPKMKPYLSGVKNTIHIIDLEKTKEKFVQALEFIQELIAEEKTLLMVGTKFQVKDLIKEIAKECNLPYVCERWLGGTFTNFLTMLKRVEHYKELRKKRAEGEFEKYTKKERAEIDKELQRLEKKFGGLETLTALPYAVFICDIKMDKLAVKEARMKGIKVIGITDTSADPTLVDYSIPANDDATLSVKYILDKVKNTILHARPKPVKKA